MSFIVESLELENFRSYRRGFVRFDPHLTILHGPNAAGKTNIIEALQLLTTGTSFRKAVKSDLIAAECVHTRLRMLATDGVLRRDIEFSIKDDVKSVTVNEKKVRSVYELCSVLPCVVFTPDDLRMVKDASSKRRQEIDGLGIQLSASYARLVSEYQKIRSQRNKMMKEDQFGSEAFVAWTDRMVDIGVALTEKRYSLFCHLEEPLLEAYSGIVGDSSADQTLKVNYVSTWGQDMSKDSFLAHLKEKSEEEKLRRQSLVGPHRDDIVFEIQGRPARSMASQGQQRSIALAWKMAQVSVVTDLGGKKPLLLLDDVMSEFDKERRHALSRFVGKVAQTVITTANIDYFDKELLELAQTVSVPDDIEGVERGM